TQREGAHVAGEHRGRPGTGLRRGRRCRPAKGKGERARGIAGDQGAVQGLRHRRSLDDRGDVVHQESVRRTRRARELRHLEGSQRQVAAATAGLSVNKPPARRPKATAGRLKFPDRIAPQGGLFCREAMRSLAPLSLLIPRLERAAQLAYGLAALIGTLALWGWAIGVPRLRDLGADFAPMAPAEALSFLLLAISFYAAHRPSYRDRRASYSAAAATAAIALFAFVEGISGQSLGMSFGVAGMSTAT